VSFIHNLLNKKSPSGGWWKGILSLPSYLPKPFDSAGFGTFPFPGVAGHRRASPSAALDKKFCIRLLLTILDNNIIISTHFLLPDE
jgi:hypothetical protein